MLANLFGVINIPSSVWIDETGMIVRPAEAAPAPPGEGATFDTPPDLPQRFIEMGMEAAKIQASPEEYHAALRDWVKQGAKSQYALDAAAVVERSRPRSADVALGHAHFELASALELEGDHAAAIGHFREAHRLVPDSWTFRRQAWSLEPNEAAGTPLERFWQGPSAGDPKAWPYEGDWLGDVKKEGAENYSESWKP